MAEKMRRIESLKQLLPVIVAIIFTVIISHGASDILAGLNARMIDKVWQWLADDKSEQRIVIVDIDEASIARYGAWPWSRERIAQLSKRISQQGAAMQIFDVVFPSAKQGDKALAAQLRAQNTVLAQILAIDADDSTEAGVLLVASEKNESCQDNYPRANAYIGNSPALVDAAQSAGHITPYIDKDGVVRRMPAFICHDSKVYPALALTALATAIQQPASFHVKQQAGLLQPQQWLIHPYQPEITIPLNEESEILLPWWLSRKALISVSAIDVIDGRLGRDVMEGAWVLIGSTAFGAGDSIPTPLASHVGGVEVHAQLLSALLDNTIPYQPQGGLVLLVLWCVLIASGMMILVQLNGRMAIYGPPALALVFAMLTVALQSALLKTLQLWIPSLQVLIFTLLTGSSMAIKGYAKSWADSQRLYRNLSSYLPEHAAKWIVGQDPVDILSVHQGRAVIMYVDLRNFSNWCNRLPAEQVGAILHTFYKEVARVVQKHGGEIEKYVGDAAMALWRDHDTSALLAAQELLDLTERQFGGQGELDELPPLALGIGIDYGDILVGSFGPAQRREYTVIGKAVTAAIYLQEMTSELAWPILVGEGAAEHWREKVLMESQGKFLLPGGIHDMEIFVPEHNDNQVSDG